MLLIKKIGATALKIAREVYLAGVTAIITALCVLGKKDADALPESALREDLKDHYSQVLRASNLFLVPYGIAEFLYALYLAGGVRNLNNYQRFFVSSSAVLAFVSGYYAVTIGPEQELVAAGMTAAGSLLLANAARVTAVKDIVYPRIASGTPAKSMTASTTEFLKNLLIPGAVATVGAFVQTGINMSNAEESAKDMMVPDFVRISRYFIILMVIYSQLQWVCAFNRMSLFHELTQSDAWDLWSISQARRSATAFVSGIAAIMGVFGWILSNTPDKIITGSLLAAGSVFLADNARRVSTSYQAQAEDIDLSPPVVIVEEQEPEVSYQAFRS